MKLPYRSTVLALVAALVAVCLCTPALAASQAAKGKNDHDIATEWLIWSKRDQSKAFQAALKQHVAWRKSAGDPFEWQVYQPVLGDDLGYYLIRSGNHAWADMDRERDWAEKQDAGSHYQQDVGSHAAREMHFFGRTLTQYSHWTDSDDYRYYGVTNYHFKPGTGEAVKDVLEIVHKAVTEQKWPYSYSVSAGIGGSGGLAIIEPMKSYADMADPSPNLMEVMTKALGSKKAARALFNKFSTAVKTRTYTIYVYRPDLSTPK